MIQYFQNENWWAKGPESSQGTVNRLHLSTSKAAASSGEVRSPSNNKNALFADVRRPIPEAAWPAHHKNAGQWSYIYEDEENGSGERAAAVAALPRPTRRRDGHCAKPVPAGHTAFQRNLTQASTLPSKGDTSHAPAAWETRMEAFPITLAENQSPCGTNLEQRRERMPKATR
jgi:hypothetical protein